MRLQQHVFLRAHAALLCASWNCQSVRGFLLKYMANVQKSRKDKDMNKCG